MCLLMPNTAAPDQRPLASLVGAGVGALHRMPPGATVRRPTGGRTGKGGVRHHGQAHRELPVTIRAELEAACKPIGPNDLFIAAHACMLGAVLVTANSSEFTRVRDLKVENWLDFTS